MNNSINSVELVRRVKNGNLLAFREIYDFYFDRAYRTALMILKDEIWAEDIVQDVFSIVWQRRERLIEEMDIWYFIFTLIKNNSISKLRIIRKDLNLKDRLYHSLEHLKSYQEDLNMELQITKEIEKAKSLLTPQQRLVYELCKEESLSYQDVADKLGVSKNTVKNHMVSSFKVLRKYVDREVIYIMFFFIN